MAALPDEHGMDVLDVTQVEVFEHHLQPPGRDVRADVEQGQPGEAHPGQGQSAGTLAIAYLDIPTRRDGPDRPRVAKRPTFEAACEVEADAVVSVEVGQRPAGGQLQTDAPVAGEPTSGREHEIAEALTEFMRAGSGNVGSTNSSGSTGGLDSRCGV